MPMFKKRDRLASVASIAANKGLLNEPGENNCFLNSAIQVLWHLDVFRRSFRLLHGHACMGASCIFCALKDIFQQFQHSKAQALPPNVLRSALAETFQQQNRFQLGYMDDAAECFENILLRMHVHLGNNMREDVCTAKHCISHQKFGLSLVEQCVCQCGATSEPLPFIEMVHYVSATALCAEDEFIRRKYGPSVNSSFGRLIRDAESWGERKNCPSECGARVNMRKVLMNCPDVVSVGIIWDSEEPQVQNISDLVHSLGTTLRLSDLFHTVVDERASLMDLYLVGMVCYYGKHYSTFFFHTKLRKWVYFDDAQVSEVGKRWSNVVSKCIKGHHQPLLLLYANPEGKPINSATAPNEITLLPGCMPVNGARQYDRVILSNIKEADSLSSEGEVTSFADEESSGTESMQATTIVSPPPARSKPKSRTRDDTTHRSPVEPPAVMSTEKRQPRGDKMSNVKPDNRNVSHKPLTPEVVRIKEKQPRHQPKILPITIGQVHHKVPDPVSNQQAPVPVKKNFEEKPAESNRKPTFQWNMASEKPRASNGVKVGEYKEPQPAQWTKYKPYPQANKANERRPRATVTDGRKSPQTVPLDLEVKSMDSKGMATFALARKSSNTDSASSTTTMQQQRTPPTSHAHLPAVGDRAVRRSPVSKLRRTSQTSDNSSMSGISMSSSQPESLTSNRQQSNSPVVQHNTTPCENVVSPESSGMQNTNTNHVSPQGGSTCQGAAHEITNCLPTNTATTCQQGPAKPPLPRKPPFLSIPFAASSPPTPNLATVTPPAYPTMHPNPLPQSNSNPTIFPNTQANAAAQILSLANRMQRLNGVSSNFPHSNPPEATDPKSEKAELLLREAEERFEQSRQADNLLDYSTALQLCLEATKMVEVVLLMEDVPTECMVQARIKHGECVNKARILQRRKNIRMQARGKEAGGNRSSMTEADRHMNQSEDATSSTSVTSSVKGQQLQEEQMSAVEELDKEDENLINFNKAGMTNLQHQVNQIYEHHNQVRQHPDYRPHAGLRPPHGSNSNNSNNNSSTSLSSAKSQHQEKRSSSSSSIAEESDGLRTKIFVWKRPEDEDDVVEMAPQRSVPPVSASGPRGADLPASKSNSLPRQRPNSSSSSLPRGVNPPSDEDRFVRDNNSRRNNPHPANPSVDEEIQENMKSLGMNPSHRFRSKTPTPQGASELSTSSVGQQRRAKTPTPMSNKEMMRARMGSRSHGELPRPRPKSAYGSASEIVLRKEDTDGGISSQKFTDKSSSGTNSPTSERPTSAMGAPYAYPGWPPANHMMPMGFNPAMLSPNFYPYMMDMWQYYNNMTPEQKNLFAANMQNHKPPTFPVSTPMTAPPAMKAAYLESLKLQLGRNLKNFTNNVNQLPPARNVNPNIYEQNKPRPIAKSDHGNRSPNEMAPSQTGPPGRPGPNGPNYPPGQPGPAGRGGRQAPNRRPPMGSRPDGSKYGRPNDVIPSRGHPAPHDPGRERRRPPGDSPGASVPPHSLPPTKQPLDDRQRVNHHQQQGMMKWAEEAKKRAPGPGIPPQYKDKIIQDFRSRRGNPQFASTSALPKNVAKPSTNGATPPAEGDKEPHNCELCGLVKVQLKYCDSCKAYLSRFKPTVNSRRGAVDKA